MAKTIQFHKTIIKGRNAPYNVIGAKPNVIQNLENGTPPVPPEENVYIFEDNAGYLFEDDNGYLFENP